MIKIKKLIIFVFIFILFFIALIFIVQSARLPIIGGDSNNWGTILNSFLTAEHTQNGTHGNVTIEGNLIVNGSLLYVNSSSSKIGIGTTLPLSTLHINGTGPEGGFRITNDSGFVVLFANSTSGNIGIGNTSPVTRLEVFGIVKGKGLLIGNDGDPTSITYSAQAQIIHNFTSTFGSNNYVDSLQIYANLKNRTNNLPNVVNGFESVGQTDANYAGNVVQLTGAAFYGLHRGSGNITDSGEIKGSHHAAENLGSGNGTILKAAQFVYANTGTGVVKDAYGIFVESPSVDGSNDDITNSYGIFVDNQDKGTNKWQIYSAGTAPSYLAGRIGLNVTNPATILQLGTLAPELRLNSTSGGYIGLKTNSILNTDFDVQQNGTSRLYLHPSGSFGINTTSPSHTLAILGTLNITAQPTRNADFLINPNGNLNISRNVTLGLKSNPINISGYRPDGTQVFCSVNNSNAWNCDAA